VALLVAEVASVEEGAEEVLAEAALEALEVEQVVEVGQGEGSALVLAQPFVVQKYLMRSHLR
jgi:hypothetical protein